MPFKFDEESIRYWETEQNIFSTLLLILIISSIGLPIVWINYYTPSFPYDLLIVGIFFTGFSSFFIIKLIFVKRYIYLFDKYSIRIFNKSNDLIKDIPSSSITKIDKSVHLEGQGSSNPLLDFIEYNMENNMGRPLQFRVNNHSDKSQDLIMKNSERLDDFMNKNYEVQVNIENIYY